LYGANVYGFVHRTFLEYFCAADQVHRFEKTQELSIDQLKETFKQQSGDETWHEVLRLICGMIDPKFACELVETLLSKKIRYLERYSNLVFAQSCLDEIATSAARENTSQRLFEAWKQFATDPQEDGPVRREAVYALVLYCKGDSETLPLLKQLATDSQENQVVRGTAVHALAYHYKENSEILPWLKQFATDSQENQEVRRAAVYVLASYYASETLPLLKQVATDSQEKERVRSAAVDALARMR